MNFTLLSPSTGQFDYLQLLIIFLWDTLILLFVFTFEISLSRNLKRFQGNLAANTVSMQPPFRLAWTEVNVQLNVGIRHMIATGKNA